MMYIYIQRQHAMMTTTRLSTRTIIVARVEGENQRGNPSGGFDVSELRLLVGTTRSVVSQNQGEINEKTRSKIIHVFRLCLRRIAITGI